MSRQRHNMFAKANLLHSQAMNIAIESHCASPSLCSQHILPCLLPTTSIKSGILLSLITMNERTHAPLPEPKGRFRKPGRCQVRKGDRRGESAVMLSRLDIDHEGQLSEVWALVDGIHILAKLLGGAIGTGFLGVVAEFALLCRWC